MTDIHCSKAERSDIKFIVKIHMLAFPGFFLTNLGESFLSVMYRAFLKNKSAIFLIVKNQDVTNGFAVGAINSIGNDYKLALRFLPEFIVALIPAVFRNPAIVSRRIFSRFFATGEQPVIPDGAAVLRSIGLTPSAKGSGLAGVLLREFERHSRLMGASLVALTTDAIDNQRAINFYRKNGYEINQKFKQDGSRCMLLMIKNIS